MTRPNEYSQINQGIITVGWPTYVVDVAHEMGTMDYCMFLTQDVTEGGGVQPRALQFCYDIDPLIPATATRQPYTAPVRELMPGGDTRVDVMFVTAHSMLDVGPIVMGETRTIADMFRRNYVYNVRPGYRSLHRHVQFLASTQQAQIVGGAFEIPVTLTHRMATGSLMVFATPSSSPLSVFAPPTSPVVKVGWRQAAPADLNSIVVYAMRDDGLAFGPQEVYSFDIMVVSRPAVGHSIVYHGNRSYTAPVGPNITGAPVSIRPDYRAGYPSASLDGFSRVVRHNNTEQAAMLLFGYTTNTPGAGFVGVPYIVDRAPVGVDATRDSYVDTDQIGYAYPTLVVDILVVSPHSMFTSLVVAAPVP
jgi:hypothetical protein